MTTESPVCPAPDTESTPPRARPADPAVMVIFGASGDLTRRKLVPALYNLRRDGMLPDRFAVLGVARRPLSDDAFREAMTTDLDEFAGGPVESAVWTPLARHLHYLSGEFDDPETYARLLERLPEIDAAVGAHGNVLFYLATPPSAFAEVALHLGARGLTSEADGGWRRLIVEKPFGYDLDSARALNAELASSLHESQIYRIDHYLGKETVQNILAFRFANGVFEPVWNRRYIDHVQITVAEAVGIEGRGGYYDAAGALRDMVQNHMFQLLALVAMEPPISFRADDVRNERVKVLHAIDPFTPADVARDVVRGQYGPGAIEGRQVRGYPQEPSVRPRSSTETFVALRIMLGNWRWAGVPFYLRTGKALPRRVTEVVIEFKRAPFSMFRETPIECMNPNVLVLRIQPDEGISLRFDAKRPGPLERLSTVTMDFLYKDYFGVRPSTGYETLLYDALIGDPTLFHRIDIVEAGWQAVAPILDAWRRHTPGDFPNYAAGTWGPAAAEDLMRRDGREWRR